MSPLYCARHTKPLNDKIIFSRPGCQSHDVTAHRLLHVRFSQSTAQPTDPTGHRTVPHTHTHTHTHKTLHERARHPPTDLAPTHTERISDQPPSPFFLAPRIALTDSLLYFQISQDILLSEAIPHSRLALGRRAAKRHLAQVVGQGRGLHVRLPLLR